MRHSAQDFSKRTLVYMGIFFIEAIKKSPGIKNLSLLITFLSKTMLQNLFELFDKINLIILVKNLIFSINQNLNSLHQGDHRFSHAFFTKVFHFQDNRKNVQF